MNTTKEQVFQFPASKDQERLWILSKFKQVKGAYNMPGLIHVKGNLNLEIFKACITDLLVRHEPLRTSFTIVNDQLFQLINEVVECDLPIIKINDSESLNTFIQNKIHSSLDLQYDKLFNVYVIDKGDFEYSILVLLHHAIADGWSLNVLLRDLSTLYTLRLEKAEVLTLPELEIQFMDVVGSEIEFASTIHYDNQLNFWKAYLEGIPELLDLPTVNLRKRIQSYEGKTFEFTLEPNLVNRLKEISSQENTSLFVTLLAAFKILLTKYSNQDDITVGILHANREHQAIQDIIGFFVKTLPIRTKLTNDSTFRKVINNISRDFTSILKHKDISFYDIANATNTSRVSSHNPIFQVLFSYENIPNVELKLGNLSTTVERLSGFYSKFDLALDVKDKGDQNLVFSFEYNIDLFNETFIEQLKEGFIAILNKISLEPTKKIIDIDALSNTERNTILNEWNNTSRNYDTYNSLIDLFKENVNRFPNQIASVYGNHSLTYKELDNLSDVYANYLFNKGIRKSDFVCLVFERNEKLLPVLLAIMKTGATYIPIDPSYPKDRVSYIVNHSESKYIITHKSLKLHTHSLNVKVPSIFIDECVEDENTYFTQADFQPIKKDSIAYCIYTSGSTGLPKGVEISHKALVNFLLTMKERPGMKTGESILAVTSISFDISGLELYLPLISGGTTIVCPYESIINPEKLVETINRHNPSLMQATPSLFKLLKSVNWQGKKEMKIFCGGESFPKELAEWLKVRCDSVWNMYGPTETTIWSLTHEFEDVINDVPIGRPIANTQIFILDQYLKPIPIGVIGDLYIGGNGLATSYYKDPEQTDTKFINWQCDGHSSRIYKTGDRAKYDTLGNVYFMGRKDFQVKLNGHRIELEEIEAVLNQIDFIKQTVVLVDKFGEDNQHLIAYLETNELSVDIGKIRSIISTKLPAYMVPAKFIAIKKFPLTANGKIDRKNIHTEKNFELLIERKDIEKPLTETEDILLKIWEKVLNIKPIGITDDFLSLGGSSISSVKITSLASAKGVIISPEMLFEYPTIKELALASSNTTDINIGADITAQQEELSLLDSFSDFRTDSGDKFKYDIIKRNMVIESIGKYIPEIELSSTDIVNSCLNKIRFPMQHITGIESIRKLPKEKDSISLAISAVENCLTSSKYNPLDIDLVISCGIFRLDSNNGIQIDPSFSHQIKHHFGMSNAQNFDISNACAGLFTGLIVAESFLRNNTAKRCMIFSSEYLTHITETAQLEVESISDKKIAGLTAGDAGLAMIVELGDNGDIGFQDLHLFTMGEYSDLCIIKPTERSIQH